MNFDEEEVKAVKRKNRQADNIMLNDPEYPREDVDSDEYGEEIGKMVENRKQRTPYKFEDDNDSD